MRSTLGSGYLEALWKTASSNMESADFVMFWWDRAAGILTAPATVLRRFGLVTTNSITQTFNRRVLERFRNNKRALSLVFAIADHPWTKATDDAASVRIAMTVAAPGQATAGVLQEVTKETDLDSDQPVIDLSSQSGVINSNLTVGADVAGAKQLLANKNLSHQGVILVGEGFRLTGSELEHLGYAKDKLPLAVKKYVIGRDLVQHPEERYVIDFFGYSEEQIRKDYPKLFQIILERVKPQRDEVNREKTRVNYWIFAEPRSVMREALTGLTRQILTCRTAKHRTFEFANAAVLADAKIISLAFQDAFFLGVLSSSVHLKWALSAGAWLGVGNDSNYNHSECFAKFPFPYPGELLKDRIRTAAEELDAFRKERQKQHPTLTLTQMYNVLEKLRGKAVLDTDEERIKDEGLVLILKELHDRIDRLVFQAYGWPETLTDEQILEKLVALNHERAAEERRGHVRWLRPDYQIPRFGKDVDKMAAKEEGAQIAADLGLPAPAARKLAFPSDAVEQTAAVFAALAAAGGPVSATHIAQDFRKTKNLEETIAKVLSSLARLGHVAAKDGRTFEIKRVA